MVIDWFPKSIRNGRTLIYVGLLVIFLFLRLESNSYLRVFACSLGLAVGTPLSALIDAVWSFWKIANPVKSTSPNPVGVTLLKKEVVSLIGQSKLEEAIQMLLSNVSIKSQDVRSELTLILQRLSEIKGRESKGFILPNEAMIERTRLSQTLIELLKRL